MPKTLPIHFAPLQGYTELFYRNANAACFGGIDTYYTPFVRLEKGGFRHREMCIRDRKWGLEDYRNIPQYNWQDEIFRSSWMQSHNVSLTGGSEGVRYNASLSYYDQDGILLESNYKHGCATGSTLDCFPATARTDGITPPTCCYALLRQ